MEVTALAAAKAVAIAKVVPVGTDAMMGLSVQKRKNPPKRVGDALSGHKKTARWRLVGLAPVYRPPRIEKVCR
ncbi:hypothetical protein D3C78_1934360 [compost metagenome]